MKRSNGALLLARTGETHDHIATAIGVSRAAASYWISGAKRPGPSNREALSARYKIPPGAWDEEPAVPRARLATATGREATSAVTLVAESGISDGVLAKVARLEQMADNLLRGLEDDAEAFPLEKARVMNSVAATFSLISKLNGDFNLGSRFFKLPIWRSIEKALEAGLRGHPEAAAAVARELRRAECEHMPPTTMHPLIAESAGQPWQPSPDEA